MLNDYCKILRLRRVELGIKQKELANRIGCTVVTLNRLEKGMNVATKTFIRACEELRLSIELKPLNNEKD